MLKITECDLLAGGYTTRAIYPKHPCPKCRGNRPEVVGAQCYRDGRIFGEYRCRYCGEYYGERIVFR